MAQNAARAGFAGLTLAAAALAMTRVPLLVFALALGCSDRQEVPRCQAALECPVIDEEAADGDVRYVFGEGQLLDVVLNGYRTPLEVTAGEVVITPDPDDPECTDRCAIVIKRLRLSLEDLFLVSSEDALEVSGLEIALEAPLALEGEGGAGHELPAATRLRSCATAADVPMTSESALVEPLPIELRPSEPAIGLEMSLPVVIDGSTYYGCERFELLVEGALEGAPE